MDIASMLEVEVQELADSKENVTPIHKPQANFPCKNFSKDENDFYKLTYGSDVASVRFLKLHCTGCDEHIGSAPAEAHNMHEHPVLRTLLCAKCREFYGDGTFEQGDDATDMFCRWCANGGNLYCCSYCSNTFCSKCIKRNFDPPTIKRIEAEDSWKCFVCDPKDLYPLRSIARALITHIETVTRILENDKRMTSKEIEEKMHLDETKCCSRKRKRRRRRTMSNSDDDEEEDMNYVPEAERPDTPPVKRRKVRRDTVRNIYSNGYLEHEHYGNKRRTKVEPDMDPSDLMIQCEQTMIEGDTEILNPNNADDSASASGSPEKKTTHLPQVKVVTNSIQQQARQLQQQFHAVKGNNSMAINPVPLANLLKVALSGNSGKKIKVTHTSNSKLVAVPMTILPKPIASSSLTFVKPATHFLLPKNRASQQTPASQPKPRLAVHEPPSVIDLDSDDEPVILENNVIVNNTEIVVRANNSSVDHITADESVVPEQVSIENNDVIEDEPVVLSQRNSTPTNMPTSRSRTTNHIEEPPTITIDGTIPLKTQQRDQRFKKMLILQSQEIDGTLNELKTKVLKLIQTSYTKPQASDLLNSAALCTKRFHRALRKTLVELAHINDRVVRDYVHWKKKTDKAAAAVKEEKIEDADEEANKQKSSISDGNKSLPNLKDNLTVEMTCVRDSASESEDEDDDERFETEERSVEAVDIPPEFAQILDHLSIFKRKPTGVKAVGDSSVLTEDKACQADDVLWRDYEKCIGYSLVTSTEFDSMTKEEARQTVVPDENSGKYQEQYVFYLQHIEDFGIETDELKGLPDPNHIPLKDLIDGTSPFITDMLERLSPVMLSNECTSPKPKEPLPTFCSDKPPSILSSTPPPACMDTSPPPSSVDNKEEQNSESQNTTSVPTTSENEETEEKSLEDNVTATSKAVEELQKMVTKLSEDLRSEQATDKKETENDQQTEITIVDTTSDPEPEKMDVEIVDVRAISDNDDCTTID